MAQTAAHLVDHVIEQTTFEYRARPVRDAPMRQGTSEKVT
jgi:hypothetical protein